MNKTRRKFSASFKAKVAIEAIKEQQTIHELASKYEVQASQINTWKREFLANADSVFAGEKPAVKDDSKEKELYSKIGELQIQVDLPSVLLRGFKKGLGQMSLDQKRRLVCPSYRKMSVHDQCRLIGLPRSSYYFKPQGISLFNQQIMHAIDKKFLDCPFYGVERMTTHLRKDLGYPIGVKRIRRMYKLMNLKTIFPKKNLSWANKADYKFPYLLRNLIIDRTNQVWQADITYIPMFRGFMYMFAIIDVYSRKIMGWGVSNTMSAEWRRDIVLETMGQHGKPEIFNTDQGSQFTSGIFVSALQGAEVQISMDGKGRALDNVYIERFWGSPKREKIYLNPPNGGVDLYQKIKEYVTFYNTGRRHDSLEKETPDSVYYARKAS